MEIKSGHITSSISKSNVKLHEETNGIVYGTEGMFCYSISRAKEISKRLFECTPQRFQTYATLWCKKAMQYYIIRCYIKTFICFFAVPLSIFLAWCICLCVGSALTLIACWIISNIVSIGFSLIVVSPFFWFSLFGAGVVTFLVTMCNIAIQGGKTIYRMVRTPYGGDDSCDKSVKD
ncbi:27664_t:CDS:2 [Dentiscutata erythropus]|uniref:27664_t:CDS:1 n=1 Tax=Dentiscutata erythropus TaxID=1348616 RepID=A0A9N9CVW0_9GLOM|nr:27664_t:CDS:2 [Dentiscutata erythropus]